MSKLWRNPIKTGWKARLHFYLSAVLVKSSQVIITIYKIILRFITVQYFHLFIYKSLVWKDRYRFLAAFYISHFLISHCLLILAIANLREILTSWFNGFKVMDWLHVCNTVLHEDGPNLRGLCPYEDHRWIYFPTLRQ